MHDINLAAELADEIVLMSHGKVVAKGSAEEALKVDNLERTFDTVINQLGGGSERYFRAELEKWEHNTPGVDSYQAMARLC